MNARDAAKAKFIKSHKTDVTALHNFKHLKHEVTQTIHKNKITSFNKLVNDNVGDSGRFWRGLKQIGVTDSDTIDSECLLDFDELNNYFASINNNPSGNPELIQEAISNIDKLSPLHNFEFATISEFDILKAIKSIKTSACGYDNISIHTLKLTLPYCLTPLVHIINCSLLSGVFPSKWKCALIKPIPKKAKPIVFSDFRPISLLPILSKIIEKIVRIQLVNYLTEFHLLDPFQSGFKSRHSTATALLKITNDIYNAINQGEITLLTLLDYSKAFDTIHHNLLLTKLKSLGIQNTALNWFKSYLSDTYQKVKCGNNESDWRLIINGVPQGSILGPLLFIIMTSDISKVISTSNYHLYADDTQLYKNCSQSQMPNIINQLNVDLSNIVVYSDKNALRINPDKSVCMFIGSHHNVKKMQCSNLEPLIINQKPIKVCKFAKNLGVTFDEVLSWRKHIDILISKAYLRLKCLYRHKNFLTTKSKIILCDLLVLSIFNYCDVVYYNISEQYKYKIQKVQNSCIRFIFSLKRRTYTSISKYIKKINWFKYATTSFFPYVHFNV
jgi:hypothetical protein